ncbi:glutamine synthetase/guanido kinase [Hymenopellis radicata]|nr:glutamine synthetase/guanido kinase [Hymenopellis radicata]
MNPTGSHSALGVPYSPATLNAPAAVKPAELSGLGISYVRVIWVDLTCIVRCRVLPLQFFLKTMESSRPGLALARAVLGMVELQLVDGVPPAGEWFYVIDPSTLRLCPYDEGMATVMGYFQHKVPVSVNGSLSLQVDLCPRTILERVVESAKRNASVEFLVGFEIEFILLKSTDPIGGLSQHVYSGCSGLMTGSPESRILRDICDSLIKGGIEVNMYHPEAASGQYEIVTGPLPPLQASDALIYARETITNVAYKHNYRATFAPRISPHGPGSGAHTHISIHSTNGQRRPDDRLASFEESFLAGLLKRAKAIPAISMPLPISYARMQDGIHAGGTYVCWGTDNREVPIRLTNLTSPLSRNFEVRFVDGTANPYLALAMILGAGARGVAESEEPAMKDLSDVAAAEMTPEQRAALGITEQFPLTWEAAREELLKDSFAESVLGKVVVDRFLAVHALLAKSLESEGDEGKKATKLVKYF